MIRKCSYLCDQEAGVAFGESAHLTGHNYLQHVSMQLLHDDKDVLHRLEHPLQQDHTKVGQTLNTHTHTLDVIENNHNVNTELIKMCQHLQDGRFVPQLSLLFCGEARLVDNFDGDRSTGLPVST